MKKIWQKSLASMVSAALCLTAFVGCLTVNAATTYTGTIKSNGVAVATTATEAKLDVAVSVAIPEGTPGIAYTGLQATTNFGKLTNVEIKSGEVKVEELSTDGVTSIPAIDENGSFIIAAMKPTVGANDYVLTLTFTKKEGLVLADKDTYPVAISYLKSQDVGAANWNEDPIGFNVEVKDITVTAAEEDYITYTTSSYDIATSTLTVGRDAMSEKLYNALTEAKKLGNRVVKLVVDVGGSEFLFDTKMTTGAGLFTVSGFALSDINSSVSIHIRVTANGGYLLNTNKFEVSLVDMITAMAGTDAKATAFLQLNETWATTTDTFDVTNAIVEKGLVGYTGVSYDAATNKLTIGRAPISNEFYNVLQEAKNNGNRVNKLVVDVNGEEFLFDVRITTGEGVFEVSGFALPDFAQNVKIYVRITSGANGEYVTNTNAVTVNLHETMQCAEGSAFAEAYNTYYAAN